MYIDWFPMDIYTIGLFGLNEFDSHLNPNHKLSQQKKCKCNVDDASAEKKRKSYSKLSNKKWF